MKIAQISPLYETVPPKLYGGTERVVAHLTDALVDLGHEVTLFASGEAKTRATLVPVRDKAIRLDPNPLKSDVAAHLNMLQQVYMRRDEFDVLHFHIDLIQCPLFRDVAERTITTLHGRQDLTDLAEFYARWSDYPLVSISDNQRTPLPDANWAGTVHHGMPSELFDFHPKAHGGYLAFLGRISPEKRPDRAIDIARRTGVPLKIAAKIDSADVAYYQKIIEPLMHDPIVEFIGEIGDDQKSEFLGNARALLFPIDWPEPFGLAMIEAIACGTPVIAWNCGSVPEVIDDGETGFIVDSVEQACEAVRNIDSLNRRRVRHVFENRFSATIMAKKYQRLYERIVQSTVIDPTVMLEAVALS